MANEFDDLLSAKPVAPKANEFDDLLAAKPVSSAKQEFDNLGRPVEFPRSPMEHILDFSRDMATGIMKLPVKMSGAVGGLIGKLSDKTGNTTGMQKAQNDQEASREANIDSLMGAEPGIGQTVGDMAGTLSLPVGGAIEKAAQPVEALMSLLKFGKAAKPLSEIATSGAVNAGLGAVQGENSGNAGEGALMGLLAGAGVPAAGKLLSKAIPGVGSMVTKPSYEALTTAATPEGKAMLEAAALRRYGTNDANGVSMGNGNVTGMALKSTLDDWNNPELRDLIFPHNKVINDAIGTMPDIDIREGLNVLRKNKQSNIGGMGTLPMDVKPNADIDQLIGAMFGHIPTPEQIAGMDFEGNLAKAQAAIADPQSKWGVLNGLAEKSAENSGKAANRATAANSVESDAVLKALKMKGAESDAANSALQAKATETEAVKNALSKNSSFTLPGGSSFENPETVLASDAAKSSATESNIAASNAKSASLASNAALKTAKKSAAIATDAFKDAQAKAATGSITAQDASKAKTELDQATTGMHVADAANEFAQGKTLDEVSRAMVDRYKLTGPDLESALTKGRDFVGKNSFVAHDPGSMLTAPDALSLMRRLSKSINYDTGLPYSPPFQDALKDFRYFLKTKLNGAAESSGNPQYVDAMKKFHEDLDLLGDVEGMGLGQKGTDVQQEKKAGNVLQMLLQGNKQGKQADIGALRKFQDRAGIDVLKPTAEENLADQFGQTGTPSWLPGHVNFHHLSVVPPAAIVQATRLANWIGKGNKLIPIETLMQQMNLHPIPTGGQ